MNINVRLLTCYETIYGLDIHKAILYDPYKTRLMPLGHKIILYPLGHKIRRFGFKKLP